MLNTLSSTVTGLVGAMLAMSLTEMLGWAGMLFVASAFLLNAFGRIGSTGRVYLQMNLLGAFTMGIDLWSAKGWSGPFALQIFWGGVLILALWKKDTNRAN